MKEIRLNSAEISFHERAITVPDNTFKNIDNAPISLNDFQGDVLVVNFWATWCQPCIEEMDELDALQEKVKNKRIKVLPISIDRTGLDPVKRFYEWNKLRSLGIYQDPENTFFRAVGGEAIPLTLIINPSGQEVGRLLGQAKWDSDKIIDQLTALLKER